MFGKKNVQQYTFERPIETYSQREIAEMVITRKKHIYGDIEFKIGKDKINTIDCDTPEEFLDKYQDVLNKNNIPTYRVNPNYDTILLDSGVTLKTVGYKNIDDFIASNQEALATLNNDTRNQVIEEAKKLVIKNSSTIDTPSQSKEEKQEQDLEILPQLDQMMAKKKQTKEDVTVTRNGIVLSTEKCNINQDIYLKYSDVIFDEYEKKRNSLLASPSVRKNINSFSSLAPEKSKEEIDRGKDDFLKLMNQSNVLDFNSPMIVNKWLTQLAQYINDPALKLGNTSSEILELLEKNGYNSQVNEVKTMADFYKKIISYQMADLKDYQMFATDYAEKLAESEIPVMNNNVMSEEDLKELYEQQKTLMIRLAIIEKYEKGLIDSKGKPAESFAEQKEKLQQELNAPGINQQDEIKKAAKASLNNLKSFAYGKKLTDAENKALASLNDTEVFPENENIIETLKKASALPDKSEIKSFIIDASTKLFARYNQNKDFEDQKEVLDVMEKLGITPFTIKDDSKDKIKAQIAKIDKEEKRRLEKEKPIKNKLEKELTECKKLIKEAKISEVPINEEVKAETAVEQEQESFSSKLSKLADEGRIFSDENRISEENKWMELNTAKSLGRYNNEDNFAATEESNEPISEMEPAEQEQPATANMEPVEEDLPYDMTPKEDKLRMPHPIKSIKKATSTLINKIKSFDFKEKIKNVLNELGKHKVATTLAIASAIVIAAAGFSKSEVNTDAIDNQLTSTTKTKEADLVGAEKAEEEVKTVSEVVEAEEPELSDDDIWKASLENALNDAIGGSVYVSVDRAINNIDPKPSLDSAWESATPGAYYTMEDGKIEELTEEEAKENLLSGEEVIARYDNNGKPIGYVPIEQQENTSGMAK